MMMIRMMKRVMNKKAQARLGMQAKVEAREEE